MVMDLLERKSVVIGVVRHLQGDVWIYRAGMNYPELLKQGDFIYRGDRVDLQGGRLIALESPDGKIFSPDVGSDGEVNDKFEQYFDNQENEEDEPVYRSIAELTSPSPSSSSSSFSSSLGALSSPTYRLSYSLQDQLKNMTPSASQSFLSLLTSTNSLATVIANEQTQQVLFYDRRLDYPILLVQNNSDQAVLSRFKTNSNTSFLLKDWVLDQIPVLSPYHMLLSAELAVPFSSIGEYTAVPAGLQNQLFSIDYQAAPISTANLQAYRIVMILSEAIDAFPEDYQTIPLISHLGWIRESFLDRAIQWHPVPGTVSNSQSTHWCIELPTEAFVSTVGRASFAFVRSVSEDLKTILSQISLQDLRTEEQFFNLVHSTIPQITVQNTELTAVLQGNIARLLFDERNSSRSLLKGINPSFAGQILKSLLNNEIAVFDNLLSVSIAHNLIGRKIVMVSPAGALPEGTLMDLQMKSSVSEFVSILERPQPIVFETRAVDETVISTVSLTDAYHYFAKNIILSNHAPLGGFLVPTTTKIAGYSATSVVLDSGRWAKFWVLDGTMIAQSDDFTCTMDFRQGVSKKFLQNVHLATAQYSSIEKVQQGYQALINNAENTHPTIRGADLTVNADQVLSLLYHHTDDRVDLTGYIGLHTQLIGDVEDTRIIQPIGIQDPTFSRIEVAGQRVGIQILGAVYLSQFTISQLMNDLGVSTIDLVWLNSDDIEYREIVSIDSTQRSTPELLTATLNTAIAYDHAQPFFVPIVAQIGYISTLEHRIYAPDFQSHDAFSSAIEVYIESLLAYERYASNSVSIQVSEDGSVRIEGAIDWSKLLFIQSLDNVYPLTSSISIGKGWSYYDASINDETIYVLNIAPTAKWTELFYSKSEQLNTNITFEILDNIQNSLHAVHDGASSRAYYLDGYTTITESVFNNRSNLLNALDLQSQSASQSYNLDIATISDLNDSDFYQGKDQIYTFTTRGLASLGAWKVEAPESGLTFRVMSRVAMAANQTLHVDGTVVSSLPTEGVNYVNNNLTVSLVSTGLYQITKEYAGGDVIRSLFVVANSEIQQPNSELQIESDPSAGEDLRSALDLVTLSFAESSRLNQYSLSQLKVDLAVGPIDQQAPQYEQTLPLYISQDGLVQLPLLSSTVNGVTDLVVPTDLVHPQPLDSIVTVEGINIPLPTATAPWTLGTNTIASLEQGMRYQWERAYVLDSAVNELQTLLSYGEGTNPAYVVHKYVDFTNQLVIFTSSAPFFSVLSYLNDAGQEQSLTTQSALKMQIRPISDGSLQYLMTGSPKEFTKLLCVEKRALSIVSGLLDEANLVYNNTTKLYELASSIDNPIAIYVQSEGVLSAPISETESAVLPTYFLNQENSYKLLDAAINPLYQLQFNLLPYAFACQRDDVLNLKVLVNDEPVTQSKIDLQSSATQLDYSDYVAVYNKIIGMSDPLLVNLYRDIVAFQRDTETPNILNPFNMQNYLDRFTRLATRYNNTHSTSDSIDIALLIDSMQYQMTVTGPINAAVGSVGISFDNYADKFAILVRPSLFRLDDSINELDILEQELGHTRTITKTVTPEGRLVFRADYDFAAGYVYQAQRSSMLEDIRLHLNYSQVNDTEYQLSGDLVQWSHVFGVIKGSCDRTSGTLAVVGLSEDVQVSASSGNIVLSTSGQSNLALEYQLFYQGQTLAASAQSTSLITFDASTLSETNIADIQTQFVMQPMPMANSCHSDQDLLPLSWGIESFAPHHTSVLPIKISTSATIVTLPAGAVTINGVLLSAVQLDLTQVRQTTFEQAALTALSAKGSSLADDPSFRVHIYNHETMGLFLVLSSRLGLPIVANFTVQAQGLLGFDSNYTNAAFKYAVDENTGWTVQYVYPQAVRSGASLNNLPLFSEEGEYYVVPSASVSRTSGTLCTISHILSDTKAPDRVSDLIAFIGCIDPLATYLKHSATSVTFKTPDTTVLEKVLVVRNGASVVDLIVSDENSITIPCVRLYNYQWTLTDEQFTPTVSDSLIHPDLSAQQFIVNIPYLTQISNLTLNVGSKHIILDSLNTQPLNLNYLDSADSESYELSLKENIDYINSHDRYTDTATVTRGNTQTLSDLVSTTLAPNLARQSPGVSFSDLATIESNNLKARGLSQSAPLLNQTTAGTYQYASVIDVDTILVPVSDPSQWFYNNQATLSGFYPVNLIIKPSTPLTSALLKEFFATNHVVLFSNQITIQNPSDLVRYKGEPLNTRGGNPDYTYSNKYLIFDPVNIENFSVALTGEANVVSNSYEVETVYNNITYTMRSQMDSTAALQNFAAQSYRSGLDSTLDLSDWVALQSLKGGDLSNSSTIAYEINTNDSANPDYQQYLWIKDETILTVLSDSQSPIFSTDPYQAWAINNQIIPDLKLISAERGTWQYNSSGWDAAQEYTATIQLIPQANLRSYVDAGFASLFLGTSVSNLYNSDSVVTLTYPDAKSTDQIFFDGLSIFDADGVMALITSDTPTVTSSSTTTNYVISPHLTPKVLWKLTDSPASRFYSSDWASVIAQENPVILKAKLADTNFAAPTNVKTSFDSFWTITLQGGTGVEASSTINPMSWESNTLDHL